MLDSELAKAVYLGEVRPLIPATEREWMLIAEAGLQATLATGNLPVAQALLADIHQQVPARAVADPTNTEWQRDLSISYNKLGDVAVAVGDGAEARARYQAGLEIRQRLVAVDPTDTEWQGDLSISYNKLGDVAVAVGDGAQARTQYQTGLEISQRLVAADPTGTQWQRDREILDEKLKQLPTGRRSRPAGGRRTRRGA